MTVPVRRCTLCSLATSNAVTPLNHHLIAAQAADLNATLRQRLMRVAAGDAGQAVVIEASPDGGNIAVVAAIGGEETGLSPHSHCRGHGGQGDQPTSRTGVPP